MLYIVFISPVLFFCGCFFYLSKVKATFGSQASKFGHVTVKFSIILSKQSKVVTVQIQRRTKLSVLSIENLIAIKDLPKANNLS